MSYPTWRALHCKATVKLEKLDPIERFIYDYEPAEAGRAALFRLRLFEALEHAEKIGRTKALLEK